MKKETFQLLQSLSMTFTMLIGIVYSSIIFLGTRHPLDNDSLLQTIFVMTILMTINLLSKGAIYIINKYKLTIQKRK